MSKNDQNNQLKNIKKMGFDAEKGFSRVGFVMSNAGSNQVSYLLTKELNDWYQKHYAVNITVFTENVLPPALPQNFAVYPLKDTAGFDGTLISTSFEMAIRTRKSTRAKLFWYVYDLEWKQPEWFFNMQMVKQLLEDEKVTKMTRSPMYYEELVKMGAKNIVAKTIDDFNIEQILHITGVTK